MKKIEELGCLMKYEWNTVFKAWNGCLVKADGSAGSIKTFLYNTKKESLNAATIWANNHKHNLKNPKPIYKVLRFTSVEEGLKVLKDSYATDSEVVSGEYADWLYENRHFVFDSTIPISLVVQAIQAFRSLDFEGDDSLEEEFADNIHPLLGYCFIDGEIVPKGVRIGTTQDGMTVLDDGIFSANGFGIKL